MARSVNLIVSDPGVGKTSWLASLAKYVHEETGKLTRLYTLDGGGIGNEEDYGDMDLAIAKGYVKVWYLRTPRYNTEGEEIPFFPFEIIRGACQGSWPDSHGHPQLLLPGSADDVGLFIFEGLTAFGEEILMRAGDMRGAGINTGGPAPAAKPYVDGTAVVGGPGQVDWQTVQAEMYRLVAYTRQLPGLVWWSALEGKGYMKEKEKEEGGRLEGFGPKLVGNAKTIEAVRWFGHCLGLEKTRNDESEVVRRLHLDNWVSRFSPGVPHLAVVRKPASVVLPPYLEGINGHPNARDFYTMLKEAVKEVA